MGDGCVREQEISKGRRGSKDRIKLLGFSRSRCLVGGVIGIMVFISCTAITWLISASVEYDEPSPLTWRLKKMDMEMDMEARGWTARLLTTSNQRPDDHVLEMQENQSDQLQKNNSIADARVGKDQAGSWLQEYPEKQLITAYSPSRPLISPIKDIHAERGRNIEAYHSLKAFLQDMKEMTSKFRVFVYPHSPTDPFRKIFDAVDNDPSGNYASESYFKKALMSTHFVTKNPSEAHLFYLPFSIAELRNDRRVGVGGIQDFVKNYMHKISHTYPFWNRSNGADHFYLVCHSVGRTAMDKALQVRINAIQVVCSSNYHLQGFVPHKDVPIPQIWPRKGTPKETASISQRKNLAFFAGGANSPVRAFLVKTWANDSDIRVFSKRISTPYSESLLTSKFCLHVKGYEVNTARIGDAMHYGCVPVVIADHYDLPFNDILVWKQFSVVVSTSDIPSLKTILKGISDADYIRMHSFVMKLRKHFQWHSPPKEFDAFYTVMYELWLRRHVLKFSLS